MGAAASTLDSASFALAKAEFESVKDSKSDEELFIHMQKFIESNSAVPMDAPVYDSKQIIPGSDQANEVSPQVESSTVEVAATTD